MRIAIGPGEVAGYFSRLREGFQEIGIPCEHFILAEHKFGYANPEHFLRTVYQFAMSLRSKSFFLWKGVGRLLSIIIRILIFLYALKRNDVFIFSGSSAFCNFYELPILRFFKKKIIIVFLGSDARHPLFSGIHLDDNCGLNTPAGLFALTKKTLRQIQWIEKYANAVICHTATAQLLTKDFIRYAAIGTPINSNLANNFPISHEPELCSSKVRILHAPSRPLAKGSNIFRETIDELILDGCQIEFVELTGVPNTVVLDEIKKCDFVLDELYADIPLAMFATEAAMHQKPAIVGGYYADLYLVDNDDEENPPALYVKPENIKAAIQKLINDKKFRLKLGKDAHNFVRKNWESKFVATKYLRLIKNEYPLNWIYNPSNCNYYLGWGLSKEKWEKQVRDYISEYGSSSMMLDNKPNLKKYILNELNKLGLHND